MDRRVLRSIEPQPHVLVAMRKYLAWRRAIVRVLRAKREELGLSQRVLSKRLGMHATYIYEVEAGHKGLRIEELFAIVEALDMDLEQALLLIVRARLAV